ncbi:CCR4-NOT transcription complex subunit 7 [Pavlovales sp. CCMP2436]|nr:CCR4-NOT transcription complex subunit 7 [Pavlovales sp. CCMP2436]
MYHGEQTPSQRVLIREVWADNLDEEMAYIREIIDRYPWLAMDTEFPGCVARPIGSFRSRTESNYQNIRCNVDLLNLIQLGITFCDADGILPPGCSTWQFNFKFSLNEDLYAQDSIELLTQAGIDFKKHDVQGISPLYFAELLMVSGVVLNDDVRWISFHSGYDFGYLLKVSHTPQPPSP